MESREMRLFTRLLVAMIAIVVLATGLVSFFIYRGVRSTLLPIELDRVRTHSQVLAQGLESYVQGAEADVLAVSKFPPVQGIVRTRPGGTSQRVSRGAFQSWRSQLAAIFLARLETNQEYMQFRFIGKADGGREIVRVDHSGPNGALRVVQDGQLQAKGKRPYFKDSINLPLGSVYVSPFELNQEWGAIQTPYVPVLRVATPVHRADGTTFGIVIANLDMRPAFHQLLVDSWQGQKIHLVNSGGDYLVNPGPRREYGFDLGKRTRIQDDFPQLTGALSATDVIVREIQDSRRRKSVAVGVPMILAGQRPVILFEVLPYSELLAAIAPVRRLSILAGLVVVFCAAVAAVLISKSISRPLDQIIEAAEAISQGRALRNLPTQAAGELGVLACAFEQMVRDVQEKTAALQKENEARKKTEVELEERIQKERILSAVVESTSDAVLTKTLEGVVTGWNDAATHLYGYTPEEMMGKSVEMIIPNDKKAELSRILGTIGHGDMVEHFETVRITKDGRPINVSLTVSPIKSMSGEIVGASAIARDITERKRAEELFRLAVNASASGMIMADVEGIIHLANDESDRMFGYERGELIGKRIEDLIPSSIRLQHVEHRLKFFSDPMARSMRVGRELLGLRKDGTEFPAEIGLNPINTEAGLLVLVAIVDITETREKRALEDQLRQSQKLESVGRLAGGVAHDFNNILTVILGCGDLLRDSIPADDPARKLVEQIYSAGTRATKLTRQLLAFSRQEILQPRILDLNTSINESREFVQRLIGEDIQVRTVLESSLWLVKVDPSCISQIIMNLAVNSRDAMPSGGILTLETQNVTMDAAYVEHHAHAAAGDYVMLAVADTGTGMDRQTQARIFDPFFTTKEKGKGTGLGLATVYGIVKQSGGFIWVYSELGQGTTFKIYLPRTDSPQTNSQEAAARRTNTGTETVLLVEDDQALRNLAALFLVSAGYKVLLADCPEKALELAASHGGVIHLLLTDVILPGINGRMLAEKIVASRPGIKVLYVSGYTDDTVVRKGIMNEEVAFLQKPYTREGLSAKVREILDGNS